MEPLQEPALPERFEVLKLIGTGFLGSVWLLQDKASGLRYAAKVFDKARVTPDLTIYLHHLQSIAASVPFSASQHMLLPRESGETTAHYYQIFDFLPDVKSLDSEIDVGISARDAFEITCQVATALGQLHSRDVIHCDIKPSNILIKRDETTLHSYLIDFGMIRRQTQNDVFIVGTYAYLHPALRSGTERNRSDAWHASMSNAAVGPYLDIYSAGVVLLEMLTGTREQPAILTEETLNSALSTNEALHLPHVRADAAKLLYQMLSVRPGDPGVDAQLVARAARELTSKVGATPTDAKRQTVDVHRRDVDDALDRLEHIAETIVEATGSFVLNRAGLKTASAAQEETEVLDEVGRIFENALTRARTAWWISLLMTIGVFVVLLSMIVAAVAIGISTGRSQWALVFGGASVPIIIGVIIWKPYDRLFRAAVLTQQLEIIHIQTVAGFRGTSVFEKRIEICASAVNQLSVLLGEERDTKVPGRGRASTGERASRRRR